MPMSAVNRYERLKDQLKIDDTSYDTMQTESFSTKIVDFLQFAKKVEPLI